MIDRYKRLATPVSAVLFVAATVVAISLGSSPDSKASGAKVIAWFHDHHTAATAQSILFAYAGVLGFVYFATVASFLRRRGADVLALTTAGGGVLFAGGLALAAGTNAAILDRVTHISADTAQTLNLVQNDLFWPMMFAGLFLSTLGMGVSMLRTGALPKALGIITVIVGVAAGTGIASWPAFMASGPLTLVIAGFVYHRLGQPQQWQEIALPDVPQPRAARNGAPAAKEPSKS